MSATGGGAQRPATAAGLGFQHVYEPRTSGWTLLLLHGTGGDEHDLIPLGRQLASHATLISPRGKVLENGMPRYFRRLAMGRFDISDLIERTDELAEFIAAATREYELDATRIAALGFSNGANIAVSILFRRPELLRAAALLRPTLPYEPKPAPALPGTEVMIAAADDDPYSSPEQIQRLVEILRAGGAEVTAHIERGAGHALTQNDLFQTERWLSSLTRGH